MRQISFFAFSALVLVACGGKPAVSPETDTSGDSSEDAYADDSGESGAPDEAGGDGDNTFQLKDSDSARDARGESESKIKATATEAAVRLFVVDKEKNEPIPGIVISLTAPDGKKYYTEETDAKGFAEALVPVGMEYEIVYLSLGRREISAKLPVENLPNHNIKLTLRYKGWTPKKKDDKPPTFTLDGVTFDTGKATIKSESYPRLDSVVEYLMYKKSARIEISGHTDNVGNPANNKSLSLKRAEACRDYLVKSGIDKSRIEAIGYGDERPIASNDSEDGRSKNRRIEAKEL